MAYLSLYRKWRPKNFSDITGQEVVVKTLTNSLKNDRIAHAYLFCGPRGTGKTSTAKVFAKSLNCEKGPTVTPCEECLSCKRINEGRSMDVIEIDAASNRGIDEIRDLREKVRFSPTEGKYKVYIVDEVHMLTKGAFNALLKTLEEPPERVVFILATTEPHQLLPTILSRCQRFDFRLHSAEDVVKRLTYICSNEGVEVDREALFTIARTSEGSMRDAISLLDQVISYAGEKVCEDDVNTVMGRVDTAALLSFNRLLFLGDIPRVLERVNDIVNQGKDISQLLKDLVYHYRNLLIIKECGKDNFLINMPEEIMDDLEKQTHLISKKNLIELVNIFSEAEKELKWSGNPYLTLEMTVLKAFSFIKESESSEIDKKEQTDKPLFMDNREKNKNKKMTIKETQKRIINQEEGINIEREEEKDVEKSEEKKEDMKEEQAENVKLSETYDKNNEKLTAINGRWDEFLDYLKNNYDKKIYALLLEGNPISVSAGRLYIQFPENRRFHQKNSMNYAAQIEEALNKMFGYDLVVQTILAGEEIAGNNKKDLTEDEDPASHPLVREAMKLFNARIVEEE